MNRNLRIMVDVDDVPRARWPLDGTADIILHGRRLTVEKVGCVLCCELEGNEHVTLSHLNEAGIESFICLTHGDLVPIEYTAVKLYKITIGAVVREGEERTTDVMLFPSAMGLVEREDLVRSLLDSAEDEEHQAGAAPTD